MKKLEKIINKTRKGIRNLACAGAVGIALLSGTGEKAKAFNPDTLPNNPIAYYPFNGNANDETGNGYNGTVYGATLSEDRFGNSNNAYHFDGYSAIFIDNPPNITSSASFGAWVCMEDLGERVGGYILNKGVAGTPETYSLVVTESKIPQARVHVSGGYYITDSNQSLSLGEWTHLLGIYGNIGSESGLSIYVNGWRTGFKPVSGALDQNSTPLYFGADYWNDTTWKGSIDEVRIYDYPIVSPSKSGDANSDGLVNDFDLSLLLANWNLKTDWSHGDFSGDGFVADKDLSLLLSNWTGHIQTSAIPEPSTISLLTLGGGYLALRRKNKLLI